RVVVFRLDDADVNLPEIRDEYRGLESLGDLPVRIDDRFQQRFAGLIAGNSGEVRPDIPSLTINLVTADAGDLGTLEEDRTPAARISPHQGFPPLGKRIIPATGGVESLQHLRSSGPRTFGRGFQQ